MTKVIGVNHLLEQEKFTVRRFVYPQITSSMKNMLKDKTVALELLPLNSRISIKQSFWNNNPHKLYSLFNPETSLYFSQLEKHCGDVMHIDSESLVRKQSELDTKFRDTGLAVSRMLSINNGYEKKPEDYQNNHKLILNHFKIFLEYMQTDFDRDDALLENILTRKPEVAVVEKFRAYSWMRQEIPGLEFFMEDTFSNVPLEPISADPGNFMSYGSIRNESDFMKIWRHSNQPKFKDLAKKYEQTEILKWQTELIDKNRKRQPDYIGVCFPFHPRTYFEIFMEGENKGISFDAHGKAIAVLNIKDNALDMERHYTRDHLNLNYSGVISPKIITGSFSKKDWIFRGAIDIDTPMGDFAMMKNDGNALDTFEKLYSTKFVRNKLLKLPDHQKPAFRIDHFPENAGLEYFPPKTKEEERRMKMQEILFLETSENDKPF